MTGLSKGLDFVGHGKSIEFVFLWNDTGLCFSNMTNMMRVRTKTLEV